MIYGIYKDNSIFDTTSIPSGRGIYKKIDGRHHKSGWHSHGVYHIIKYIFIFNCFII